MPRPSAYDRWPIRPRAGRRTARGPPPARGVPATPCRPWQRARAPAPAPQPGWRRGNVRPGRRRRSDGAWPRGSRRAAWPAPRPAPGPARKPQPRPPWPAPRPPHPSPQPSPSLCRQRFAIPAFWPTACKSYASDWLGESAAGPPPSIRVPPGIRSNDSDRTTARSMPAHSARPSGIRS